MVFVVNFVLKTRPKVHGDRAQLQFDTHVLHRGGEKNGDPNNHVQAPVAVGLGILDVILDVKHFQIRLAGEHFRHAIHVGVEAAHNAYARHVQDVLLHRFKVEVNAEPLQLLHQSFRRLEAGSDVL